MPVKIKFLRNYTVKALGGPSFKRDEEVDIDAPGARHFVSRGLAEYVTDEPAEKPAAPAVRDMDEPAPDKDAAATDTAAETAATTTETDDPPADKKKPATKSRKKSASTTRSRGRWTAKK